MARVTVEDCLKYVDSNYALVLQASKRARDIANGAEPLVERDNDKPAVIALREIADNVTANAQDSQEQESYSQQEAFEISIEG